MDVLGKPEISRDNELGCKIILKFTFHSIDGKFFPYIVMIHIQMWIKIQLALYVICPRAGNIFNGYRPAGIPQDCWMK
jgi:hypothetical protein